MGIITNETAQQTGESNEAKQERLSILCFWQMLTWFSEKLPQESKTVLLKERRNKYLTSWQSNRQQKKHKKMSQVCVHLLFITKCPRKKTYRNKFIRCTRQAQPLLFFLIYVWLSVPGLRSAFQIWFVWIDTCISLSCYMDLAKLF